MKRFSLPSLALAVASCSLISMGAQAKTYNIDPDHSSVSFKIRHGLSDVPGRFTDFVGKFETDDKGTITMIHASIKAKSVDTNNKKRDNHLRSADFFNAKEFSEINFTADKAEVKAGKTAKVKGQLTLHGVTQPVTWEFENRGLQKDPMGNERVFIQAKIDKLNRKDYGMIWNKALDNGWLLGDNVAIEVNAEAVVDLKDEKVAETPKKEAKKH